MLCTQVGRDHMTVMEQNLIKHGRDGESVCKKQPEKEIIHSGHFMVSDFEAEAQDDSDELAIALPEELEIKAVITNAGILAQTDTSGGINILKSPVQNLPIETSLTKLFQCMSLAYRQKLTSPKWNPFKGIRLRWKDKIRLNNVIWRCWHMQFIDRKKPLVCQFASPLDVDTHNKPEAVVLEGKYWKRKLSAVTAEYKKWRMYYRNQILGHSKDGHDVLSELGFVGWQSPKKQGTVEVEDDYMEFMNDTLFSTITLNQPFAFPDTREIARGASLADFIQPSLVQLQPNLEDFMDTLEPLQDLFHSKLAPVPEEPAGLSQDLYKTGPYPVTLVVSSLDKNVSSAQTDQSGTYTSFVGNNWFVPPYTPPNTPDLTSANTSQFKIQPSSFSSQNSKAQTAIHNTLSTVENQSVNRRDDLFAVPKIKLRSRSQSGNRKDSTSSSSTTTVNESVIQSAQPSQNNSALLEQLLTSQNASATYGCLENDQSSSVSQTSTLVPNRADVPYTPQTMLISRPIDNNIYQSQIDVNKSQYPVSSSNSKRNSVVSQTPASSSSNSNILISPSSSPLPTMSFVGAASPESPTSDSLCYSPQNIASPNSSSPSMKGYKEHRRVCHINAEQKRRCNIKNGFDTLQSLIPQLNQNPNVKMSKAALLQKGADYIRQLRNERNHLKQEIDSLRLQIETLNSSISNCQAMLPATGAPVSKQRNSKMQDMFQQYVQQRTHEDWKFWILSLICDPLLRSFSDNVSTSSLEEFYRSTLQWVDEHCSLIHLREVALNSLLKLCTATEILTDPGKLSIEARAAVDGKLKKGS